MFKRIAITGPECTGKSILAEKLAMEFNTVWIPEFAREYLDQLKSPYEYQDILNIAKGQYQRMNDAITVANKFIFYDTDLLVTKIWCEYKYGKCHPWIREYFNKQEISLYLLMDIDLPWQPDPLREHPNQRNLLFDLYKKELDSRNLAYKIISGTGQDRFRNAINAIKNRFQ